MDTERMLKPALIGGVLLGILSALLPFINCLCCAWVMGGGLLAAYLYVKDSPNPVSMGNGVVIGLFAGIIGAVVSTIFSIPLNYLLNPMKAGFVERAMERFEQTLNLPLETREALEALSVQGSIGLIDIFLGLIIWVVIFCPFAMLGGAIGVAVFEKRKPGDAPPNQSSYQPPPGTPPTPPAAQ